MFPNFCTSLYIIISLLFISSHVISEHMVSVLRRQPHMHEQQLAVPSFLRSLVSK